MVLEKKLIQQNLKKKKPILKFRKTNCHYEIAKTYYQIVFLQHQEKLYHYLDSLYHNFSTASNRRFELGETNYLEKITAEAKFRQIKTKLTQIGNEKKVDYVTMQNWVQSEDEILIKSSTISPLKSFSNESNRNIHQSYLETVSKNYESQLKLQKQNWLPDLHFDVFRGSNKGISQSLNGFQVGIAVPILYGGNVSKSKVAQLELESWEQQKQNETLKIDNYLSQKQEELAKYQEAINYYNQFGKKLSDEIIKVGNMSYKHGEIDFFQYIQSLENATIIQVDYLDNVLRYNQTQLEIQYLNY